MRTLPGSLVFGRAESNEHGWTNASLSRAARSGRVQRAGRGLYALAGVDAELAGAVAATLWIGGSVVSHRSALLAHGLPLAGARPRLPEITVPPRGTGDAPRAPCSTEQRCRSTT